MGLLQLSKRPLAFAAAIALAAVGCGGAPSAIVIGRHLSPDSKFEAVLASEEDPRNPIGATSGNITKVFIARRGAKVDLTSKATAEFEDDGLSFGPSVDVKWDSDHDLLVTSKHMRLIDGTGTWQSGDDLAFLRYMQY